MVFLSVQHRETSAIAGGLVFPSSGFLTKFRNMSSRGKCRILSVIHQVGSKQVAKRGIYWLHSHILGRAQLE